MVSLVNPAVVQDGVDVPKSPFKQMLGVMRDEITALQNRTAAALAQITACCGTSDFPLMYVDDAELITTDGPALFLSTTSLDIGTVIVGDTSTEFTITLTSDGSEDLVIDDITITGPHASNFTITDIS